MKQLKTKKIVPITFLWQVPNGSGKDIIFILNSFIKAMQDSGMNIYERLSFTFEPAKDKKWVYIRARYGFDGTTNFDQQGKYIEIDSSFITIKDNNNENN